MRPIDFQGGLVMISYVPVRVLTERKTSVIVQKTEVVVTLQSGGDGQLTDCYFTTYLVRFLFFSMTSTTLARLGCVVRRL